MREADLRESEWNENHADNPSHSHTTADRDASPLEGAGLGAGVEGLWSDPRMRSAVDYGERAWGDVGEEMAVGNACYDQPRQHIKKQRHYVANKGPSSQGYGFSSSHVWMWELDYKESWVPKHWCYRTVVLEKALESSLDCNEIQPVHPKGNQLWIFIGRTDVEVETPILWPPDLKNWLIGKDPDAGKDWRWEEKGDDRGWDGWMASPTQWTLVWINSRRYWITEEPEVLQSMGPQRVRHDLVTE